MLFHHRREAKSSQTLVLLIYHPRRNYIFCIHGPPFLGLEKLFRLPQCVILGKASQQGSEFWFDIKRGELIFHWGIADLQCGVSFGCIAKWFSYTSTYIVILLFRSFSCRCCYRILSSLCYMVDPCWSSASSMVVYVCEEGSHVKSCGLELHTIDPYRFGLLGKLSPHSPCSLPLLGLSFCLTLISQLSLLS